MVIQVDGHQEYPGDGVPNILSEAFSDKRRDVILIWRCRAPCGLERSIGFEFRDRMPLNFDWGIGKEFLLGGRHRWKERVHKGLGFLPVVRLALCRSP